MKSPSHARLSAQWKITLKKTMRKIGIDVNARLTRSYPLFRPIKATNTTDGFDTEEDTTDSDATIIVDTLPATNSVPKVGNDAPTIKCSVKTTTYGIRQPKRNRKPKRNQNYKCILCKKMFSKLALLNRHYINNHPPTHEVSNL